MKSPTGINVKEIKLLDKTVKANFKKIFTALSKAAILYATGKWESAAKELADVSSAFELKAETAHLAYELLLTALCNAAHDLATENSYNFRSDLENADKLYDHPQYAAFLEGITNLIEDKEIILEWEMLQNPRQIPILPDFQAYFQQYLELFGIATKEAELISNRLPTYFIYALNAEWSQNYNKYSPISEQLNAPTASAARKERQWEAYYSYLEKEIEKPVFGESFGLKDIFIPLRAYYIYKGRTSKVVVSLKDALDHWLNVPETEDTIKVIQGGPGAGKSSFVKWWVAQIAKDRTTTVLFFPLHHFNIHTNIKTAIGEYFKDADHIPLNFNPLEDTSTSNKILLVFDGLDELLMQGKSSKEVANAFMQELKDFCRLKNQVTQKLRILVTG